MGSRIRAAIVEGERVVIRDSREVRSEERYSSSGRGLR